MLGQLLHRFGHSYLLFRCRVECRIRGNGDVVMLALVIGWPRKGRIHDHEVELVVSDSADEVLYVLGAATTGGYCGSLVDHVGRYVLSKQLK